MKRKDFYIEWEKSDPYKVIDADHNPNHGNRVRIATDGGAGGGNFVRPFRAAGWGMAFQGHEGSAITAGGVIGGIDQSAFMAEINGLLYALLAAKEAGIAPMVLIDNLGVTTIAKKLKEGRDIPRYSPRAWSWLKRIIYDTQAELHWLPSHMDQADKAERMKWWDTPEGESRKVWLWLNDLADTAATSQAKVNLQNINACNTEWHSKRQWTRLANRRMWSKTAALRHTYPLKYDNQAARSWSEGLGDFVANSHDAKDDIMAGYHDGGSAGCDHSYSQFPTPCVSHGVRSASCVLGDLSGDLSRDGLQAEQLRDDCQGHQRPDKVTINVDMVRVHDDGQGHQRPNKVINNVDTVERNGGTTEEDQKLQGIVIRRQRCEGNTGRMQYGSSKATTSGIPNEDELDSLLNNGQDIERDIVNDAWEELFGEDSLHDTDYLSLCHTGKQNTGADGNIPLHLGGAT